MDLNWCATCSKTDYLLPGRDGINSSQGGETKQEVLNQVTDLLKLPRFTLPDGGGSSLPKDVFEAAARAVNVPTGSMPEICEQITRKAGIPYSASFDSRASISGGGSTVTLEGIQAMRRALEQLL